MHRLLRVLPLSFALALIAGCAAERDLASYDAERFVSLPDDVVRVGDHFVRAASLDGEIAGEAFDGSARVRSARDDYGHFALELALPTERGAVMHLIEFDSGVFDALTPGQTLVYDDLEQGRVWPLACAGPQLDAWELDVPVQHMSFDVVEGADEGDLAMQWSIVASPHDAPTLIERSQGRLLLSESAPVP
jgi:hypothetical protein